MGRHGDFGSTVSIQICSSFQPFRAPSLFFQSFLWRPPHHGPAAGFAFLLHPEPPGFSSTSSLDKGMAVVELSKTLIIVIAASGSVVYVALLFFIFKCLGRSKSAPLPPIQPLAHQRERESKYISYPDTPRRSMVTDQVSLFGSRTSSKPSLLPSYRTDESSIAPFSSYHSPPPLPPLPTDIVYWPGAQSVESGSDEQPPSLGHARPRKHSRSNSLPSASTHVSTRSARTGIRGAPHSRHSQVEVVLPTPLAPGLQHHMVTDPSVIETKDGFTSTSDPWIKAPNRSTSWRAKSDQSLPVSDASSVRPLRSRSLDRNHFSPPRRPTHLVLAGEVPPLPYNPSIIKYDSPALPPRTLMTSNSLSNGYGPYRHLKNTPKVPFPQSVSR